MKLVSHDIAVSHQSKPITLRQDKKGRWIFAQKRDKALAEALLNIEEKDSCAGMAAPQYGKFKAMFVWRRSLTGPLELVVNPEIVVDDKAPQKWNWEGCFSVGLDKVYWIRRPSQGHVRYWTLDSNCSDFLIKKEEDLSHFAFRVFQHEFEHLKPETIKTKSEKTKDGHYVEHLNKQDPCIEAHVKQRIERPWSEVEEFDEIPREFCCNIK